MGNAYIPREQVHAWSEEIGKNPAAQRPLCEAVLHEQQKVRRFLEENLQKLSPAARDLASRMVDVALLVFYVAGGRLETGSWEKIRAVSATVQERAPAVLPADEGMAERARAVPDRAQPHLLDEAALILLEGDTGLSREDAFKAYLLVWLVVEVLDALWSPPMGFSGDTKYHYVQLDDMVPDQPRLPAPMPSLAPSAFGASADSTMYPGSEDAFDQAIASIEAPAESAKVGGEAPKVVGEVEGPSGTIAERVHNRFESTVEVTVHSEHNFYSGFTENISTGGLFVATTLIQPIGTVLEFELKMGKGTVKAQGEVRWIREFDEWNKDAPPGMGVRFLDLDPKIAAVIDEFIHGKREAIFYDDDED